MRITLLKTNDTKYTIDCNGTNYAESMGCDHHNDVFDYFLTSEYIRRVVLYKTENNKSLYCNVDNKKTGIRPVLEEIEDFDKIISKAYQNENGQIEVEFGKYPQNKTKFTYEEVEKNFDMVDNNIYFHNGKFYKKVPEKGIFEISPVKWLVDTENKRLISKYVIESGIAVDSDYEYTGDFINTEIYNYLNSQMLEDLFMKLSCPKEKIYSLKNNDELISNIQDFITIGYPVLLFGDGEEEKNDILRELDSDFYEIDFVNIDNIPKSILDDTTNTHIIKINCLNIETAITYVKTRNFPPNIKVVYSTSSNTEIKDSTFMLPFKIKSFVPSILKKIANYNLHPLIYSLIIYLKDDEILEGLDEEDEKTLKIMSDVLYRTNNLALLKYFTNETILEIIIRLSEQKVYTLENIINRNYNSTMSKEEQALTIPYLTTVGEDDIEIVRNFIIEMNISLLPIFDYLWSYNNKERKKIISELNMTNNMMVRARKMLLN